MAIEASEKDRNTFRDRFKKSVRKAKSSQKALEEKLDLPKGSFTRIYAGKKDLETAILQGAAKELDADAAAWVKGTAFEALLGEKGAEDGGAKKKAEEAAAKKKAEEAAAKKKAEEAAAKKKAEEAAAKKKAEEAAAAAKKKAEEAAETAREKVKEAADTVKEAAETAKEKVEEAAETAREKVKEAKPKPETKGKDPEKPKSLLDKILGFFGMG